jgi:hypothetical protein
MDLVEHRSDVNQIVNLSGGSPKLFGKLIL